MSIFLNSILENTGQTNDVEVPVYEGFVNPETEGLSQITQEALLENYQIQSSLLVMDAVNYSRVTEGHETIVTESAVKNIFQKMKDAWIKFWSKVTAWFKSSIESIKTFFMEGSKFVKEYKQDLLRVDAKGHSYTGYKWAEKAGEAKADDFEKKLVSAKGQAKKDFPTANPNVEADKVTVSDYMEGTVYKGLGVDNLVEIKKEINEAYRGGESSAEKIEDMSAVSVAEMIKFVEGVNDAVKSLEKSRKQMETDFKDAVKEIDEASKAAAKADRDNDMTTEAGKTNHKLQSRIISNATTLDSISKNIQSMRTGIVTTKIQNIKSMQSEFVRVLKSVRAHKAVKESAFVEESATGSDDVFTAIFESMK